MTDPETHNHHPQQQQQHAHVQRPTEAQLRWAQFRHKRAAVTVQEKIMQLWLQPASVREVPGARSDDGHSTSGSSSSSCSSNGNRQEEKLQPRRRARRKREKPKISRGRRALLRVSNRLYEQRHQQIEKDGFRCGDVDPDEEEEDALAAIFAEGSSFRKKRKRKLSSKQDEERIRRFESAFYAMMMSLAPKKHNDTPNIVSSRKWTRPPTMNGHFSSVDGNNQNSNGSHEWNWGRGGGVGVPKSASKNPTGVPDAFNFDHGASWLVHLPPKDKTFTHVMRQHLGDVAVTFLTDNNNNTTATTADQPNDEDVAATLVEHFERHVSVSEEKLDIVVVTPRDIASLVARLEQATTVVTTKRRGHEVSDHVGTVVTPTTADLVSRFENPTVDKEGFVQRFVAQMEQAAKVEQLVSADGKLHKPTFARLVKEYLGQKATTHPRKSSPLPSPILDRATVEPTDSSKSISGSAYPDKDDLKETKNLAVFVQNFILQVEQDDELEKIVTSKGALNRPVFEKRVNCYLAEATRQCRLDSSSNTADRGSRFENQVKDKVGFVQRFVAQMEKSVNLEKLVSADGKLHKPTFARLVKEYLGQASTKRREFTFVRQSSRQSPLQAQMVKLKKEAESDIRTLHDSDDPDDSNVSSFVRIFIQQMEQDDKVDTIVTSEGTLNMPVFEKLVNRYLAEATQRCLQLKEEGPVTNAAEGAEQKTLGSIRENDYPLPLLQDDIPTTTESMQHDRTPIRMTNFFGRIRSVGAKVNSFRFGRDEPSTAIGLSGGDGFVDRNLKPANQDSKSTNNDDNANACYFFLDVSATTTVNHNNATDDHNKTSHVAESVSNKVGELFKILNSKDIADETAAYSAFRQVQDKKRRGATDDASSQSSFRVLPAGIRKVVKGFRGGKSKLLSSHIQDDNESRSSDTDDDALLDDEDDFDDESDFSNGSHNDPVFSSADVKGLQATLLMNTYGLSSEQSIIDTDGSIISGNDMQSKKVESLMLSPTILTKRLQQAIRAVETRKWDQVKYLLSANPWLAEMADVNTNQYVLHKLAFYGAGQLGIDHTTGEVIAIRRPPAPEQINFDLVQLFPSSVHKLDRDGNLPLHMAAASGNYAMIKLLGDRFPSGASVRNEDGMLPLHLVIIACASPVASTYAAGVSATDIVRTVAGYFPGAIGVTDNDGNLPIHTAASALQGDIGASIIYFLLDEAERQVSGPSCLRFRNKCSMKDIETESFDTETTATPSDTSNHLDDDTNCLLVHNEMGHVPLLLSIYAHAGWEVIEALASCGPGGLQALDSDNNNALHLLVSDHCKDASAALAVLRVVPEAATARNENGMLPIEIACMQMLPREVILALVLIDLPINLDRKDDATLRKGFGASWWYVACECDDYYVDIVEEVVTLCSFAQVRALCLLKDEASDVLLGRATPKSKSTLARALRFLGRYEFVDSDPIYTDACCGVKAFNALDFGTQEDPAPDNKRVVLKCFSREDSFVHETAVLRELDIDVDYFEEIVAFAVGGVDADKSPLANDGRQRFFVSIERPYLTLSGVVRGMLGNHDCQNDVIVRQRYSAKVFSVLRVVAKALQSLHGQGFIHGDLCLENCGKYDDKWKLSDLLGAQKIGETFDPARLSSSAPPEAIEPLRTSGTKRQVAFRTDLVSRPSFDSWAFGKLAYEVLVGDALVAFDESKSIEEDYESLTNLVHWNDFNVEDARQHLERVGISNAGISLVTSCLSPDEETRLSMDGVLTHAVWSELRRQSQSNK